MSTDKKPDGGPAYPVPDLYIPHLEQIAYGHHGMTLRDKFAGDALIGLLTHYLSDSTEHVATLAYQYADAMLKARGV